MALFYKRPLACACAFFVVAISVTYFLSLFLSFLFACIFCAVAVVLLGICLLRGFSYRKLFVLLLVIALALGSLRTVLDRSEAEKTLDNHQVATVTGELVIKDVLYQNAYGAEFLVEVADIPCDRAVLRCEFATPFAVGDRIGGEFLVEALDHEAYYEGVANEYFSNGAKLLLIASEAEALSFLESGTNTIAARLSRFRAVASFRIADTVGGEAGKLLSAMLLGTKDKLADSTVRDFRLSGVSHLLALSGLHLMILVGLLDRLLYLFHASKRVRIAIVIPVCLFYLILTGCNYSLLRAMLMLGALYLSFLLREHSDSITTLFLCAALILSFTPYAVFSLSFQMTMLATFGILAFARVHAFLYKLLAKKKGIRKLWFVVLRGALTSILITLTTTLCLAPVLWLTIGSYSLMTPLANLLLVPIAPLLLFGAVLCLLLPFSSIGAVVALAPKLVLWITRLFSSFDLMISLTRAYVPYILIPLIIASAVLLILDLKQRYFLTLVPFGVAILAFAIAIPISHQIGRGEIEAIYRREGKNEGVILVQNESAVICDVSASSLTQWRADWYAAQQMGATRLEVLMLTHYHSKSVSALSRFAQSAYVHALWLPQAQNAQDEEIQTQLLEIAEKHDLSVTIYGHERELTVFGSGALTVQAPLFHSRSSEPALAFEVSFGAQVLCYHTAALSEYQRDQALSHDCKATHLILGAHGPVPHASIEIPPSDALSTVLVGNEEALMLLKIQQNLRYYAFSSEQHYVLK